MQIINRGLGLFLAVVLIATIFIGCAAAPQQAEEPEQEQQNVTVRVVMLADLTGPYGVTTGPQLDGCTDWAKWANETDFLPGVTFEITAYDHGLKMEQAVALYKEAVTSTPTPAFTNGGLWSSAAPTLHGLAKQNKIPIVDATSLREVVVPPGWFWGFQPAYEGQVGAYINWIVDNWKADSKVDWIRKNYQNRKPRLGLMSWDIALGRANESVEAKCYAEAKGVEWVGAEYVPLTVGDCTPQLTRFKDKVDFIFVGMFGSAWQAVLKKADEMGMRNQFIDVGPSYFSPPEIAEFTPNLANNNGACSIFAAMFDEYPKVVQDAQLKTKYPIEFGAYAVGWYDGDLYAEIIKQTGEKVGYDKINGQAVQDMLCAGGINKFKPMISANTITWANNSSLVKMDGGDSVEIRIIQGYDPATTAAKDSYKNYVRFPDTKIPSLLPGGKDIPAGCK